MSGRADDPLVAIADALRTEGGLLADVTATPAADADRSIAERVSSGPRAAIVGPDLAFAAEATREAELLHHAPEHGRIVRTDDRDLALLVGDRLLALGLQRLAAGGWVGDIAILADVVAMVATLHAAPAWARPGPDAGTGPPDEARDRTRTLWTVAANALGHGASSPEAAALAGIRDGRPPTGEQLESLL
ncbi:MAG: hypothetical protein M0P31_05730 [Solirubrobacteraceae bacterium]|nr:hypothetical protein [Solirubrobacteraceae bacterium]